MPLVTGLDGRVYEIPEDVLSKAQITDDDDDDEDE